MATSLPPVRENSSRLSIGKGGGAIRGRKGRRCPCRSRESAGLAVTARYRSRRESILESRLRAAAIAHVQPPAPLVRRAEGGDLDGLVRLEERCFELDRLSRRSLRHFLTRGQAALLVAERGSGELAGYALVVFRRGSTVARPIRSPSIRRRGGWASAGSCCKRRSRPPWRPGRASCVLRCVPTMGQPSPPTRARATSPSAATASITRIARMRCAWPSGWARQRTRRRPGWPRKPGLGGEGPGDMVNYVVVVEGKGDEAWASEHGQVVTARDYVTKPELFAGKRPRVINLNADLEYMALGYYCSLLAEARDHKVIPTIQTIVELSQEIALRRRAAGPERDPAPGPGEGGGAAARRLHPHHLLRRDARGPLPRLRARGLRPLPLPDPARRLRLRRALAHRRAGGGHALGALAGGASTYFLQTLAGYTRTGWRAPKLKTPPRYSLGDPVEPARDHAALGKVLAERNSCRSAARSASASR